MTERFAVVIPALNAARTIAEVAKNAQSFVKDVIVVDDGSSDATSAAATEAGAHVLRHEVNRGKGAALKTGFRYAMTNGFDAVITLDADGQHLPSEIPKFIEARRATSAELIIGSRTHLFHQMVRRRRLANQFSARGISFGAGVRVGDSQSGFRLYGAKLLGAVPIHANGFDAESEVIVRAGRRNYQILEVPIELGFVDGVSTSYYRPLVDTLRIARTALFSWLNP